MSMLFERQLPLPQEVNEHYPLSYDLHNLVISRATALKDIFMG